MQRITIDKSERAKLAAGTLVLAFIFSIKNIQNFWVWVGTFVLMFLLSGISLLINVWAHKYAAASMGARAKFDLWKIRRFGFTKAAEIKKAPADPLMRWLYSLSTFFTNAWLVLPLLLAFFSNGQIPFAAVGIATIATPAAYRLGKKYTRIKEIETAQISMAGPVSNILFALIIKAVFGLSGVAGTLVLINVAMAISNMLPAYRLDGGKVFFSSILMYIFGLTFVLGASFLIYFLTVLPTLIVSLLIAVIMVVLFYYFHVFK